MPFTPVRGAALWGSCRAQHLLRPWPKPLWSPTDSHGGLKAIVDAVGLIGEAFVVSDVERASCYGEAEIFVHDAALELAATPRFEVVTLHVDDRQRRDELGARGELDPTVRVILECIVDREGALAGPLARKGRPQGTDEGARKACVERFEAGQNPGRSLGLRVPGDGDRSAQRNLPRPFVRREADLIDVRPRDPP